MYLLRNYFFCAVLVAFLAITTLPDAWAETLFYNISWQSIPAGTATLMFKENGEKAFIELNARTLPVMDVIYPVRTHVKSEMLTSSSLPNRYFKQSKEGWGKENTSEVLFDRDRRIAEVYKNGRHLRTLEMPLDTYDPISCLYFYRKISELGGKPVQLTITDGKKISTGVATVLRKETIDVPAGRFNTLVVEPKMEGLTGVFQKSPRSRILVWLTDDDRRLPVRLKSEVIVGAFTAEATAIQ